MEPDDPAGTGLEPVGDGAMWVAPEYRRPLSQAGLASFDAVMATSQGHCMRALVDRENWRLDLAVGAAGSRRVYLKKHHVRTVGSRVRARWGGGPGMTPGRVEAQNVRRLTREGIDVMHLVAYGERLRSGGLVESFVITEELTGYVPLEQFLRKRFPPLGQRRPARRDAALERLLDRVADVARRFHEAGYNHRDLYCCHFFIREPRRGQFDIRLIDLQRVQRRTRRRRRWIVKDLAQLAWSAPLDRITCTQKLRFMRRYLGVRKLRARDKRLIREVLAKQQFMVRKLGESP